MRKVVCAWMLLIACRSNGADLAQPDMDGVRGLSNHALCDQLQPGSKSSDALLCEIKARGLICSSLDEEGWDYTPDAHATAPSASGTAETTSGTGLNQASAESTSAPMVETPAPKSTPVEESVIRLSSGNTVGSGFYIDATHIVTNAHVVGRASQVTLARSNGSPFVGRVLFQNTDVDFAIIETDIQGSPVTVRRTPQTEGEGVMTLGYPQGRMTLAASTGTIRKITPCCIIHDALIAAGSSGGPLVDRNREVIGLNTLISKMPGDDTNSSDRGITVKLQYISQMLLGNSKEIHR
jgi:S1-C subfamily serine protease